MTITWAITVVNELEEIILLLNFLQVHISKDDEILIQYDEINVTEQVSAYLRIVENMEDQIKVIGFPLNNDFSSFKNNLTKHATKDYIVSVDADEIPHENFVERLGQVLETNKVDLVFVPRINTVNGITEKHVQKWGWNITKLETQKTTGIMDENSDEYKYLKKLGYIISERIGTDTFDNYRFVTYYQPIINYPDYQTRVYKRTDDIKWMNKVHERITGYNNFSNLPASEEWCIYHHKDIERQEKQNAYYETI